MVITRPAVIIRLGSDSESSPATLASDSSARIWAPGVSMEATGISVEARLKSESVSNAIGRKAINFGSAPS